MSTQLLNNLLISEIPEVAQAAHRAQVLMARRISNELTQDEFEELIDDLANIDNIDRSMITLETYREIVQAFEIIMALKGAASLL